MNKLNMYRLAQACTRLRDNHDFKELMLLIENEMEEQDKIMRTTHDPEAWRKAQGYRMGLQKLIDFVHNEKVAPPPPKGRDYF